MCSIGAVRKARYFFSEEENSVHNLPIVSVNDGFWRADMRKSYILWG
jgi:hypothetical protein